MSFGLNLALNLGLSSFLDELILDQIQGASAAYSVRQLKASATNCLRVRRDSDNAEQDIGFVNGELDTASLESFVNNYNDTLPLDTSSSASAAYSLRNLSSSYSGSVVRVRRDSDNTEQDFNAEEITDGTLADFCGASNGFVTTWYDQSGNNSHASQSTSSLQPRLYDSGIGVRLDNGRPCVYVDSDKLTATLSVGLDDVTIFQVQNVVNTGGASEKDTVHLYSASSNRGYRTCRYKSNGQGPLLFVGSNTSDILAPLNKDQLFYTAYLSDGDQDVYINGDIGVTANLDILNENPKDLLMLFDDQTGGNAYKGAMQEIIIFSGNRLSDRDAIEKNINKHYNIIRNNGFVTTWYDQSGNSNDAIQATQTNQPKIYDSATGLILENGEPALEFDGVDDYMSNNSNIFSNNRASVFLVHKTPETTDTKLLGLGTSAVDGNALNITPEYAIRVQGGNQIYTVDADDTQSLFTTIQTGTNSSSINSYLNGNQLSISSSISQATNFQGGIVLGAFVNASSTPDAETEMLFQESIIYDTDQSSNRAAIEDNINKHYNIY